MKNRIKKIGCFAISIISLSFVGLVSFLLFMFYTNPYYTFGLDKIAQLPQSYSFRVSEMDSLFITTLKRKNPQEGKAAEFYVIFSKDSLASLSENQDYIKFETADMGDIEIVFNPNETNDIYVNWSNYLDSINVVNYNLQVLERKEFYSLFYEPQVKTNPRILKYPYISIHIVTMSHLIFENKYKLIQTKIN